MTATRLAPPLPLAGLVGAASLAVGAILGLAGASHAALALAAVLFIGVIVVLMTFPEAGIGLGVLLLYSNIPAVAINVHGAPSLLGLLVPLVLAIPLVSYLVDGRGLVVTRAFPWLLLLILVQVVSTLTSEHPTESLGKLTTFIVEGVLIYLLVVNVVRTPEALRRAAWAVIGGGAFLAATATLQNMTGSYDRPFLGFAQLDSAYFLGHSDVARAQGPLPDANYFAQILLPSFALSFVMLWRGRSRIERGAAAVAAAVCTVGIAFTYSRGAALALALMILAFVLLRYMKPATLVAMAVAAGLMFLLVPGYTERLSSISALSEATSSSASSDADISARSRATENRAAWLVFGDHPVLGAGPGSFPLLYQEYARRAGGEIHMRTRSRGGGSDPSAGEAPEREAHNFFLGIAADIGLAGLLAFGGIIVVTLDGLRRARRRWLRTRPDLEALATGLLVALIGYLAAGLFLSLAFQRYFWLLFGLGGAAGYVLQGRRGPTKGAAA